MSALPVTSRVRGCFPLIMGWSSTAMATRYQHVTAQIRRDIAKRVDGLIWSTDDRDDGTPGVLARVK